MRFLLLILLILSSLIFFGLAVVAVGMTGVNLFSLVFFLIFLLNVCAVVGAYLKKLWSAVLTIVISSIVLGLSTIEIVVMIFISLFKKEYITLITIPLVQSLVFSLFLWAGISYYKEIKKLAKKK